MFGSLLLGVILGYFLRAVYTRYRGSRIKKLTSPIFVLIENDELDKAILEISKAEIKLGLGCPELTRARSLIHFLKK